MDQQLWNDDRIKVMNYDALIKSPQEGLEALSEFVGMQVPLSAMERRSALPLPRGKSSEIV
jgi:hypothetical protein